MKSKLTAILLTALFLLLAAGCATDPPSKASDGSPWSADWVTVGNVIGVDTPQGMVLQENNDTLSANAMYYAAWSMGEEVPYVNGEGKEAKLYDAQVYLLLAGQSSEDKARSVREEWLGLAKSQYQVETAEDTTYNGEAFTVLTYTYASEENPYRRGASAFGVYGNYALSIELSCRETFAGDPLETLESFLKSCHYSA